MSFIERASVSLKLMCPVSEKPKLVTVSQRPRSHLPHNHSCILSVSLSLHVSAVARRDSGVLSERQSGAGGLQAGHEDGRQHPEGALQTAPHPCHP